MMKMDDYSSSDEGDLKKALEEAFPDNQWDDDKVSAFSEAMRICMKSEEDSEGEGDSEDSGKPGKGTLALVFGGHPKGK